MNDELHQRLLAELSQLGLPWETSQNHAANLDNRLRWLPIANLVVVRLSLGISSSAWWVALGPASVTEFKPATSCVFLLPILEISIEEARRVLEEALQAKGLPKDFLKVFPFDRIVTTGLEGHSERWATLALGWARALPESRELRTALEALAADGPTQKLRHAAQKVLSQNRRTPPD